MQPANRLPIGRPLPFDADGKPSIRKYIRALWDLAGRNRSAATDVHFVVIDLPVKPDETQQILPWGMKLADPPMGRLFIAHYPRAVYSAPYNEAALLIHVKTPLGPGTTFCWMVVDQDEALIFGRNVLCCPKNKGIFSIDADADSFSARVARHGAPLITVTARRREEEHNPATVFDRSYNPGDQRWYGFLNLIWTFRIREVIFESYRAEGELVLGDSPLDPFRRWIAGHSQPLNMRIVKMDILGASMPLPVGIAGIRWFLNAYDLRFR